MAGKCGSKATNLLLHVTIGQENKNIFADNSLYMFGDSDLFSFVHSTSLVIRRSYLSPYALSRIILGSRKSPRKISTLCHLMNVTKHIMLTFENRVFFVENN